MTTTDSTFTRTRVSLVALVCVFTAIVARSADRELEIKTLEVNGTTIHYVESGSGEPLVFVHGGIGDLHAFRSQIEEFAKEYRVIADSRCFHPPNEPPRAGEVYSMAVHAQDLAALLTKLDASPAHIVAHSYGAYTSLLLASRASRARSMRVFLDGISVGPWFDKPSPEAKAGFLEKVPEFRLEMLHHASSSYLPPLTREALDQLKPPVLLVTGEHSPAMFLLITAELEGCLEGESHVMVPNVGHGVHQNPNFFNQAVLAFLRRHKSPEATEPATVEPQVDYARQPAPEIEAEVLAYLNTLDGVVAKLDVDALNELHMYDSDKFIRVEASMPRMGLAEGKAREDGYFRMIDKFESSFSDSRIDVIGPRQVIVTRRYKFQGFKEGKALHPVLDVWLTLVLVKDVKDDRWKIIYESLVPAT